MPWSQKTTQLNPRQERFCRFYLKYGVASKAYARAYGIANDNDAAARANAARLRKVGAIKQRIEALAAEAIQVSGIAKESATAKSSRDRLTAWSKLAQILGYEKQQIELTTNQAGDERLINELVRLGVSREQALKELGYKETEAVKDKSLDLASIPSPKSLN